MKVDVRHFDPMEYERGGRNWMPDCSARLLVLKDALRNMLGVEVRISPVDGAIGRKNGPEDASQHNIDRWGEVRAVDFFVEGVDTKDAADRVVRWLMLLGFTGIGVYPHWRNHAGVQQVGFHADVRKDTQPNSPAMWGMVGRNPQRQVSLAEALSMVGTKPEEAA